MSGARGFRYVVTDEQIREFRRVPPAEKLRRLESLEEFLAAAMPPAARRIREKFRRGEI